MLIKLEWLGYRTVKKNYDHMLSRSERYGRTDLLYQYRASVCWGAIKTVESAEYTCQSQLCNSTNSAAILRMEIKQVAAYYFLRTIMWRVDLKSSCQSSRNVALRVEQPSVLNKFFFRIRIFCHIRAWEQKVCGWGLKIRQITLLFGPPCSLRMTRKKSK